MTRLFAALLVLLATACAPARPADVVLVYTRDSGGELIVRASASGDAQVEAGGRVFIRRGGEEYVVFRDAGGSFAARAADYAALIEEDAAKAPPLPGPAYELREEERTELVAGVRGTIWSVVPRYTRSLSAAEAAISPDPSLAVAAKGLALQARLTIAANARESGGPGSLEEAMAALFEKGLVVRMGSALRLERVDPGPVTVQDFELPGKPLGRAELRRRLAGG